jgi:SAM-dependent methyltransferase
MTDFGRFSAASAGSPEEYETYIQRDPYRMGLHYPAVMEQVGDLRKRILDVGTGDGLFPRLLAKLGASVVGYDHNPEMIRSAKGMTRMLCMPFSRVSIEGPNGAIWAIRIALRSMAHKPHATSCKISASRSGMSSITSWPQATS